MSGTRQPTDLVVANGRKHLTRAEEEERRAQEVKAPCPKTAKPPKWLPQALGKEFRRIGKQLIALGIYSELDADTLGRYLMAHNHWLAATQQANKYIQLVDAEQADAWGKLQERYFKQAMKCATELGLTISSRCRLVMPEQAAAEESGEDEFSRRLAERRRMVASG